MNDPFRSLYTVASLRELDRRAIAALGGDGYALMSRAAAAAFDEIRARWPDARRLVVACGRGNNGGDGYVVARLARASGLAANVVRVDERAPGTADAARARDEFLAAGGVELVFGESTSLEADLIVDALFGIGLTRAPDESNALLIDAMNTAPAPVVALDVPSGLDADTGNAPGTCIDAELTVTFIGYKRGLVTGSAARHVGALVLAPCDVDGAVRDAVARDGELVDDDWRREALPPRAPDAHKGRFGHVLVVGGDHGYGGAARMAAEAAARSGAGLTSLATRAAHVAAIIAARPEIMVHAIDENGALDALLGRASVVAIGPGLGQTEWGRRAWSRARASGKPIVADADALNLLAQQPERLDASSILTPHPGEAARLLGTSVARVQADRYAAVLELARRHRCIVLLKGAGTLVADDAGRVAACPIAEPALATGGMGDVLTGLIAGLRAQHVEPFEAACVGAFVHARAAQRAARHGARGTLAGDLFAEIRALVNP